MLTTHLERRGWTWAKVEAWSAFYKKLCDELWTDGAQYKAAQLNTILDRNDCCRQAAQELLAELGRANIRGDAITAVQIHRFEALREELFAADLKLSQLGSGVWDVLDEQGQLDHRIAGVDDGEIERALSEPPRAGRAKIRSEFIRENAGKRGLLVAWDCSYELKNERRLVTVASPDCRAGQWVKWKPPESCTYRSEEEDRAAAELDRLVRCVLAGEDDACPFDYEEAARRVAAAPTAFIYNLLGRMEVEFWDRECFRAYEFVVRRQLELAQRQGNSGALPSCLNQVGMAALLRNNFEEALNWFERAMQGYLAQSTAEREDLQNVRANRALCYAERAARGGDPIEVRRNILEARRKSARRGSDAPRGEFPLLQNVPCQSAAGAGERPAQARRAVSGAHESVHAALQHHCFHMVAEAAGAARGGRVAWFGGADIPVCLRQTRQTGRNVCPTCSSAISSTSPTSPSPPCCCQTAGRPDARRRLPSHPLRRNVRPRPCNSPNTRRGTCPPGNLSAFPSRL